MNPQETTIITNIIQRIVILATGAPSNAQFHTELLNLYKVTGNWEKVAAVVDDYMNSPIPFTQNSESGLVQMIALNGFGLKFSDNEAEQVTKNLI